MARITKKLKVEFVKTKLATDTNWALKALMIVYGNQTADEKFCGKTHYHNNIGFTGADDEFLTSLAKQFQTRGTLSYRQCEYLMKKIKKYHAQVLKVCDEEKLIMAMHHDRVITDTDIDAYKGQIFINNLG